MKNYRWLISLFFLLGITGESWAQRGHGSLYSFFGAGSYTYDNFGMAKRLGGVGSAVRSPYFLNNINPASQNSLEVPFTFQVEGDITYNYQKTVTGSESLNTNYTNLNAIQFWMRLSQKSTLSLGLTPITQQDYSFSDKVNFEGFSDQYTRTYKGWGNANKIYANYAYGIGKRLSIGIRPSFVFANFQKASTYLNANEAGYLTESTGLMTAVGLEAGIQADVISKPGKKLTWGGNAQYINKLKGTNSSKIYTYISNTELYEAEEEDVSLELPVQLRTGLAYQTRKLLVAGDVYKNVGDNLYTNQISNTVYALGAEWVPDYGAPKVLSNMSFSLGGRYDTGSVKIGTTPVSSFALNTGVGVPINRNARISLGYQYQRTGATSLMALENTHSITLHFTFGDRWFQKYVFE